MRPFSKRPELTTYVDTYVPALIPTRWDVPVELTPPIYQALHKVPSLRNLRIRSAGVPIRLAIQPTYSSTPGFAAQTPGAPLPQGQAVLSAIPATASNTPSVLKRPDKKPTGRVDDGTSVGAFSGFTKLASVAFTDLTSLDYIADIAGCIKSSSSSLRSLSLSLSWELAQKSREPTTTATPANEPDDGDFSDDTEDMLNADLPPPPPPVSQTVSPVDARKDKVAQDAILSKVFDMQSVTAEGKKIEKDLSLSLDKTRNSSTGRVTDVDLSLLADLAKIFIAALAAREVDRKEELQRAMELMSKAGKIIGWPDGDRQVVSNGDELTTQHPGQTETSTASTPSAPDPAPTETGAVASSVTDENDEMDFDMDHPDECTLDIGPDQEMADDVEEPGSSPRKRAKVEEVLRMEGIESSGGSSAASKNLDSKLPEVMSEAEPKEPEVSPDDRMRNYIHANHGLRLEEFSLYLVPLKASVVARALDLGVLKRITLLDVGSQVPFWQLLLRLGKGMPDLGFHMIHTDDVSEAFLNFVSAFDGLQELYLHKKKKKEPETETPGVPKVDIKSIFRLGLRRHFDTMTHLMIKNDNDDSWDLNHWIVRTLSLRGSGLVELAVSLKLQTLVSLSGSLASRHPICKLESVNI